MSRQRMDLKGDRSAGFSLVELLVALTVTLIISGAIFGLLAGGQNAFQREPALTDRQQNARIAMDLMQQDLTNAGRGMPMVSQGLTDGLDSAGPGGTDMLEIVIGDSACPTQTVCDKPLAGVYGDGGAYITREGLNTCLNPLAGGDRPLLLLADGSHFSLHRNLATAAGACPPAGAGTPNLTFTLDVALPGFNTWAGAAGAAPFATLYAARVVRYELQPEGDGINSLVRSEPGVAAQIVARGIEELQVQYLNGAGWADGPGPVGPCAAGGCVAADYNAVVREVRVSFAARTTGGRIAGDDKVDRVRYSTVTAPRAAVAALETGAYQGMIIFN